MPKVQSDVCGCMCAAQFSPDRGPIAFGQVEIRWCFAYVEGAENRLLACRPREINDVASGLDAIMSAYAERVVRVTKCDRFAVMMQLCARLVLLGGGGHVQML